MYKIAVTQRALRDLDTIERNTQQRIALKLKEYAEEPLNCARKLIHPKIGTYRFRIGDYRVNFDIDDETRVILSIGHRSSIYN